MPEPGPLLLERRIVSGGDVHVLRVTEDGGVWSLSTIAARLQGGEWSFAREEEPAWEHDGDLPAQAVARLREAIAHSGFFDAGPEHHPPTTVIHGADHIWTAALDGNSHTITLHGVPEVQVAAVTAVAEALEDALAAADQG